MNIISQDLDGSDIECQECDEAGAHCVVLRPMPADLEGYAANKGEGMKIPRLVIHCMCYTRVGSGH